MRILLTGATGFIGSRVLDALLAQGHHVIAAGRTAPPRQCAQLSTIEADFTKDTVKAAWLARLTDVDVVINTVGIFREERGRTFAALHDQAPRALFAACAAVGRVHTVIQLSALGADDEAQSPYHLSKKAADDALAQLPLRAFIVQPSLVFGAGGASTRLFKTLATMPFTVRFGTAPQLVQPVHVDDVVSAILRLVREPQAATPGRIALVGPEAMAFTEYLARLRRAMGMGRLRVLGLPRAAARLVPGRLLSDDALRMLERGNCADAAAISALLGHAPRPVEHFICEAGAERQAAKLGWLLPLLRVSIAAVWIATAIVSYGLYPAALSYQLLERSGVPAALGPLMLYGAASADLLIGLGILLAPRRWLWGLQLGLIGFYTLFIAWKLPEFLLHPYGPLTKNLPMLAGIWLLYELEER